MMEQERGGNSPGHCRSRKDKCPPFYTTSKPPLIIILPCLLTVAFSKRKKRKKGRIVCKVSRAPGARVWTSSNLRHLHSCRRQGSTQECEKVGSQEVEAKHKHKVYRTNLQPRNNSAFIYSYIQPLRAGGGRHGSSSGIRRNGNWRSGAPFE